DSGRCCAELRPATIDRRKAGTVAAAHKSGLAHRANNAARDLAAIIDATCPSKTAICVGIVESSKARAAEQKAVHCTIGVNGKPRNLAAIVDSPCVCLGPTGNID